MPMSATSQSHAAPTAEQETFKTINLYGGACRIDIPDRFIDVSNLRQVPDHQEVFVCGTRTDQSIIVEIVELSSTVPDDQIASFHLEELASANQSTVSTIIHPQETISDEVMPQFASRFKAFCVGQQQVAKFHETARNVVNVYLFALRLRDHDAEVLITFNDPTFIDPQSSAAKDAQAVGQDIEKSMRLFRHVVQSFHIVDYGLFGSS